MRRFTEHVDYIVLHTAAVDNDTSADAMRNYHVNHNGWDDIGYHYVVRKDGTVEPGRDIAYIGAHTRGLNHRSIGICFSGHGDLTEWTPEQEESGLAFIRKLMQEFIIPVSNVIGHREAGRDGRPGKRVAKSCPGKLINMDEVRGKLEPTRGDAIEIQKGPRHQQS